MGTVTLQLSDKQLHQPIQQRNLLFSSSSSWPFTRSLLVPNTLSVIPNLVEVLLDSVMVTLTRTELRPVDQASPTHTTVDFLLEVDKVSLQAAHTEVTNPVEMVKHFLSENNFFSLLVFHRFSANQSCL